MRVTLAYPYEGHEPDKTIEVDDAVGKQLLRDGKARPVDLGSLTLSELRRHASTEGIDLAGATRKDDVVAAIQSHQAVRSQNTYVRPPVGEQ